MTTGGQIPALRRWHVPVLRLVTERPGITAAEIAKELPGPTPEWQRTLVAAKELTELSRKHLVQHDGQTPRHWSPALFANVALDEQAKGASP
jgi:hypothetical protein